MPKSTDFIDFDQFRRNWPQSYNQSIESIMQLEQKLLVDRLEANAYIGSSIEVTDNTGRLLVQAKEELDTTLRSVQNLSERVSQLHDIKQLHQEWTKFAMKLLQNENKLTNDRMSVLSAALGKLSVRVERLSRPSLLKRVKGKVISKVKRILGGLR